MQRLCFRLRPLKLLIFSPSRPPPVLFMPPSQNQVLANDTFVGPFRQSHLNPAPWIERLGYDSQVCVHSASCHGHAAGSPTSHLNSRMTDSRIWCLATQTWFTPTPPVPLAIQDTYAFLNATSQAANHPNIGAELRIANGGAYRAAVERACLSGEGAPSKPSGTHEALITGLGMLWRRVCLSPNTAPSVTAPLHNPVHMYVRSDQRWAGAQPGGC